MCGLRESPRQSSSPEVFHIWHNLLPASTGHFVPNSRWKGKILMKIRPGEALRNEIILQGNCQTHLFSLQEVRHCKLFQGLFWLGKKVQEKENY